MGMGNAGGAGLGNLGLLEVPHTQTLDLGPGDQPPLLDPAHPDLEAEPPTDSEFLSLLRISEFFSFYIADFWQTF